MNYNYYIKNLISNALSSILLDIPLYNIIGVNRNENGTFAFVIRHNSITCVKINLPQIDILDYIIFDDYISEKYISVNRGYKFIVLWKTMSYDGTIQYIYKNENNILPGKMPFDVFNDIYILDYTEENFNIIDNI